MNNSMGTNSILLIEDDTNLRNSFTLILQRAGYFVTPTDCIYKVMDLVRYGKYQLVITDLNMPEAKRILVPSVLGNYPYLSMVLLSDQPHTEMENEGNFDNAYYLVKPVAPERLLNCIEMVMGKAEHSM